ncbi:DUF262 domain-containing protein [Luteolibacter luteus]|uniref:DUF262 domain-containing protein n=1 Tax=Luteolibacter luteus TaxID=2728835 RepID=A0A858RIA7_9BACT|nr:DUF262 domain-containing protein [Luteolibacter luteus]QJE96238.1 DUF262 domain-containing protein [Luteolibacter luteus]
MKLLASDPDIKTIMGRIDGNELDLQPDFQRGEVWADSKKQRLIDTVLRDWHIPPIHVIERPSGKQEVLDGQQRLVAIRDFVHGKIRVNGNTAPFNADLASINGCSYHDLPQHFRWRFDRFTIRVFRLVDFEPDEPGELFFRLNQPAALTASEQRNAFFGPVREQIRSICERFEQFGLSEHYLGFSNSRMAFDDIVAKQCLIAENRSFRQKITATAITERYRSSDPFSNDVIRAVENSLRIFGSASSRAFLPIKFNKATVLSWLCFIARWFPHFNRAWFETEFIRFLEEFEHDRLDSKLLSNGSKTPHGYSVRILNIFTDRSSLRVGDVSSLILRDAAIAYCMMAYLSKRGGLEFVEHMPSLQLREMRNIFRQDVIIGEESFYQLLEAINWGAWG